MRSRIGAFIGVLALIVACLVGLTAAPAMAQSPYNCGTSHSVQACYEINGPSGRRYVTSFYGGFTYSCSGSCAGSVDVEMTVTGPGRSWSIGPHSFPNWGSWGATIPVNGDVTAGTY